MSPDKLTERNRYDSLARRFVVDKSNFSFVDLGIEQIPLEYRAPYYLYIKSLIEHIKPNLVVVELGAGTGVFTGNLLESGARVYALDISSCSIDVLRNRFIRYKNLEAIVADIEYLPFLNESVDVVVASGSLSYGDNRMVMNEIYRILKPNGKFICVDSLNNNPIYLINRCFNYLIGNRTLTTILRMPSLRLLKQYYLKFGRQEIFYFGSIAWAIAILRIFFGINRATKISNNFDLLVGVRKSAFKFVMIVSKTN